MDVPRGAAASSLQPEQPDEPMEGSNIDLPDPRVPFAEAEVEQAVAGSDAVE